MIFTVSKRDWKSFATRKKNDIDNNRATHNGMHRDLAMVLGIFIGICGGVLASLAYPVYLSIVKAKRKKLAPEIIRLADELMK